jgi:predicted lipoprotein with Yx(FWY)xxD motif
MGNILTDANGMTLYTFDQDTNGQSSCTGSCATLWPALLSNGAPVAGTGVDGSKLATISLQDGSTQVTYNGKPLYTYSKDTKAGDTTGDGVGGVWHVAKP